MSKFDTILTNDNFKRLHFFCLSAENAGSPNEMAVKCREALSEIISVIYEKEGIDFPQTATMLELIDGKTISSFAHYPQIIESLHFIRKVGMNAAHDKKITKNQALLALENLAFFTEFLVKRYEKPDEIDKIILPDHMGEAETRKIYIDLYLSEAGWDVLEPHSEKTLPGGTKVKCGTIFPSKACCEIPVDGMPNKTGIGFCDYVLYGKDGKPLAIVEAKKTSEDPIKAIAQVKLYGECMKQVYGYVPILYYTNGYEIHVMDGSYPSRRVMAFHTMEELQYMLQKRDRGPISDLRIRDDISGRPYQKMAITNICERFNEKHRRGLIVMATGTGKTRVSISLVEVLLRNKWIKNVLFLADRTSLVQQAFRNFQKILPDMSYCVLSDRSLADEPNARITFSTHQTMINYIDSEKKEFGSARFDLIIIDEAHRSIFNKFSSIFSYFDALLVGLTATPKDEVDANTYEIFNCENGEPNFAYSLEEAIQEKYLVPYKVEKRTTKLLSQGIKYANLSAKDKEKVDSLLEGATGSDFIIPKETLFKIFYNEDTCRKVIDNLFESGLHIDGNQLLGKTIIFAYNHIHAKLIVDTFNKAYPQYGEDYCQLIDNQIKHANQLIEKFEHDDNFRIAVSVDMLDTGIDVPAVLNLVFFKPVKSKIKFVQMIGRGTRLCEDLIDGKDKEYFLIFDYCSNFEYFDEHPEGSARTNGKSLSQKLFDLKLDLLVELQKYEHQSNPEHKEYYDYLKQFIYGKIQEIKSHSTRISVREKLSYVDKYLDFEQWGAISPLQKKEVQLHLTKLIDNDIGQNKGSLAFDLRMFDIELSVLANGDTRDAPKSVNKVRVVAKVLLDQCSGISAVMNSAKTLNALINPAFWTNLKVKTLESIREEVRELIKYIPPKMGYEILNVIDDVETGTYTGPGLADIRTYKEKVIDYLAEHSDHTVVKKIQNLEKINADDLKELERILWEELGTKEDYKNTTDIDNLAAFIRSIVGIDQHTINEKFSEYLNENVFNSSQQEFVKSIVDYVRENGDIEISDLLEKLPFAQYDIQELFGVNLVLLKNIVDVMHDSIVAA